MSQVSSIKNSIYFDTNIYDWIATKQEALGMHELLKSRKLSLYISNENLIEVIAEGNKLKRQKEVEFIVSLKPKLELKPQSYLHAMELLKEIKRLKRNWLSILPRTTMVKFFLATHPNLWDSLKNGDIPSKAITHEFARDVEVGINKSRSDQKAFKEISNKTKKKSGELKFVTSSGKELDANPASPEDYWRMEAASVWRSALLEHNPASRDYNDWLSPYLRINAFRDPGYTDFWLKEVNSDNLPLNRFVGLVSFFQTKFKISHGNALDQIHGGNFLLYDHFVTADVGFSSVLSEANYCLTKPTAFPILLKRANGGVLDELSKALNENALEKQE